MLTTEPSAMHKGQVVPVDSSRIRDFLANSLKMAGFERPLTPRRQSLVTATMKETMRGMSRWEYEYKVEIRYRKQSPGITNLDYELFELGHKKGGSSCEEILFQLVQRVAADAQDYADSLAGEEETPAETYGTARFANEKELSEAGYITNQMDPAGFLLAPYSGDRYISIPKSETYLHGLICGPTGAGKSSGFFIPNIILRGGTSLLVTEATTGDEVPDLFLKTAGWRAYQGSNVYFFNPAYAKGTRINPLDKLSVVPVHEFTAVADELAELVIINTSPPTSQRADPIWDKAEKHLLWIMIMHAASSGDPELSHFGAIRQLVRKPEAFIQSQLNNSKSQIAAEEFAAFVAHSSENFRHGVFAGLLQRLNPWLTDRIVTMTKTTDLDLAQLREELFTFYLSVPSRKKHLKPIAALIFNFLVDLALETRFKRPLALLLDEFTNYGAIPGMEGVLTTIRKHQIPVVLGVQTYKQVIKVYGHEIAEEMLSQLGTRVFFRQRDAKTARELSMELGSQTLVVEDTSDQGITTRRELGRPLLSVNDILTLPKDKVIVMTPSTKPIFDSCFTYKTFPVPKKDPPDLVDHSVSKSSDFLPQKVADEMAQKAKENAKPTKEDHDFIRHAEQTHTEMEKQRAARRRALEDEDWNVPG